jgi:hypothetical protein
MPCDLDRSALPCPSIPRQNPARENFAGGMGAVSVSGTCPDLWGTGEGPVVVGRMWFGAFTRAPPARDARAFRARGRPSFPQSITQALGGLVAFGPSGTEPALSHPPGGRLRPRRQGPVRPGSGVTPHRVRAGRPSRPCGSDAAGCTPCQETTGSGFRAKDPCAHPLRWDRSPRWPGQSFASFRPAGTTPANRNSPPSAGPGSVAPAIRLGGRWGECGTKREGVEKTRRNSGTASGLRGTPGRRASSRCDGPDVPLHGQSQPSDMPALTSPFHNPVSPSVSIFSGSPQCLQ